MLATIFLLALAGRAIAQDLNPAPKQLPSAAPPTASEPPLRLPSGPADVLERLGVGPSPLEHFSGGAGLSPSEEEVLAKILYHLPKLGAANLHRWRVERPDWATIAASPVDHRLDVLRVEGRVKRVKRQELLPEQAELYEFASYYLVQISIGDTQLTATVAARNIPQAWKLDADIDEPAAADGLFLKASQSETGEQNLLLAATRVAWFPDRPDAALKIGSSQVVLSRLGLDAGLWDEVRASSQNSLAAGDREAFYALLAAAGRDESGAIRNAAKQEFDLIALLEKPADHHGEIGRVRGVARRVTKVPVSDLDVRVRLGIDYYYEIDLFLPLKNASLRLGKDPSGQKNPVYQNSFPATLIVRELPPGLQESANMHQDVAADAVFFKVWAYRAAYTAKFGQLQPAPLFMAARAEVVPVPTAANWVAGALVTTALCVALGVTLVVGWWYVGGEKKRRVMAERIDVRF